MVLNHKKRIHIDEKMKLELADRLPEPVRTVFLEDSNDMDVEIFIDHLGLFERMVKKLRSPREKAVSPSGLPLNLLLIVSSVMVALPIFISSNYTLPFILITLKWILIPLALTSFSFCLELWNYETSHALVPSKNQLKEVWSRIKQTIIRRPI